MKSQYCIPVPGLVLQPGHYRVSYDAIFTGKAIKYDHPSMVRKAENLRAGHSFALFFCGLILGLSFMYTLMACWRTR